MKTIFDLFDASIDIMGKIVYLLISLALVGFFWGIVKFLFSGGNEKLKKEGRDFMIYGLLSLFVMTSLWGLISLMQGLVKDNSDVGDVNYKADSIQNSNIDYRFDEYQDAFDNPESQELI